MCEFEAEEVELSPVCTFTDDNPCPSAAHWKANHDCQVALKRKLSEKYGIALKEIARLEEELDQANRHYDQAFDPDYLECQGCGATTRTGLWSNVEHLQIGGFECPLRNYRG